MSRLSGKPAAKTPKEPTTYRSFQVREQQVPSPVQQAGGEKPESEEVMREARETARPFRTNDGPEQMRGRRDERRDLLKASTEDKKAIEQIGQENIAINTNNPQNLTLEGDFRAYLAMCEQLIAEAMMCHPHYFVKDNGEKWLTPSQLKTYFALLWFNRYRRVNSIEGDIGLIPLAADDWPVPPVLWQVLARNAPYIGEDGSRGNLVYKIPALGININDELIYGLNWIDSDLNTPAFHRYQGAGDEGLFTLIDGVNGEKILLKSEAVASTALQDYWENVDVDFVTQLVKTTLFDDKTYPFSSLPEKTYLADAYVSFARDPDGLPIKVGTCPFKSFDREGFFPLMCSFYRAPKNSVLSTVNIVKTPQAPIRPDDDAPSKQLNIDFVLCFAPFFSKQQNATPAVLGSKKFCRIVVWDRTAAGGDGAYVAKQVEPVPEFKLISPALIKIHAISLALSYYYQMAEQQQAFVSGGVPPNNTDIPIVSLSRFLKTVVFDFQCQILKKISCMSTQHLTNPLNFVLPSALKHHRTSGTPALVKRSMGVIYEAEKGTLLAPWMGAFNTTNWFDAEVDAAPALADAEKWFGQTLTVNGGPLIDEDYLRFNNITVNPAWVALYAAEPDNRPFPYNACNSYEQIEDLISNQPDAISVWQPVKEKSLLGTPGGMLSYANLVVSNSLNRIIRFPSWQDPNPTTAYTYRDWVIGRMDFNGSLVEDQIAAAPFCVFTSNNAGIEEGSVFNHANKLYAKMGDTQPIDQFNNTIMQSNGLVAKMLPMVMEASHKSVMVGDLGIKVTKEGSVEDCLFDVFETIAVGFVDTVVQDAAKIVDGATKTITSAVSGDWMGALGAAAGTVDEIYHDIRSASKNMGKAAEGTYSKMVEENLEKTDRKVRSIDQRQTRSSQGSARKSNATVKNAYPLPRNKSVQQKNVLIKNPFAKKKPQPKKPSQKGGKGSGKKR